MSETHFIRLDLLSFGIAIAFPLLVAGVSYWRKIGIERALLWSVLRCSIQLLLLGLVLQYIFNLESILLILLFGGAMTVAAAWTAKSRFRLTYGGMTRDLMAVFWVASWSVAGVGLLVGIRAEPWYHPQYAIPLLGMILGNILHGISLGVERYTTSLSDHMKVVDAKLAMGATAEEAARPFYHQAIQAALTPLINTMLIAGIVSLPGMMTGQILAGIEPWEAVKYQLFIMFLIAGGTGMGSIGATWIVTRRLFNADHQLCTFLLNGDNV